MKIEEGHFLSLQIGINSLKQSFSNITLVSRIKKSNKFYSAQAAKFVSSKDVSCQRIKQ